MLLFLETKVYFIRVRIAGDSTGSAPKQGSSGKDWSDYHKACCNELSAPEVLNRVPVRFLV